MLDLCEDLDIRSMDDFHDASVVSMAKEDRESLRASWRLARSLGYLPEHRQRIDGERMKGTAGLHGFAQSAKSAVPFQRHPEPVHVRSDIGEREQWRLSSSGKAALSRS